MKLAIIGAGISGLTVAHHMQDRAELTLFEAADQVGGHARTVDVPTDGEVLSVDTGFVVYNEVNYPRFTALLRGLGVVTRLTEMSFSVRCERSGLEYCGSSANAFFAQRRNLLRPALYRLARDIVRFNREARAWLHKDAEDETLGQFLARGGYGKLLAGNYVVPMGAAIWSSSPRQVLAFPARFFLRFFENHGLLSVNGHHRWRTIVGGSRSYVEAMSRSFRDSIRLRTPVRALRRRADGVDLFRPDGQWERFDHVVLATHADQSLGMMLDPSAAEREILSAFPYQTNEGVLHTDEAQLPRSRRARASWNYTIPAENPDCPVVTYDMTRLQGLPTTRPICITLNRTEKIAADRVIASFEYAHPLFTAESIEAQRRHTEISGANGVHYCGAYWGNGFHEDGVRSGLDVSAALVRRLERAA